VYVTLRDRPGADGSGGVTVREKVALTVILLGVVSMLTDVSSEMVNSVLPLYLTKQLGMSIFAYGFVDGLYQGVSAFVRIGGGYLGDKYRHPKWIATIGYATSAVTRLGLLAVHGFAGITGMVTVDRLGKGLRTAPRDALIADASNPASLGRSYGVHRMLDTIGATVGPLAAFALLAAVPDSYSSVWVVSFAFAAVGVAVLVLFVPNRQAATTAVKMRASMLLRQLAAPKLRRPLLAASLLGILTVGDGFIYLSLQKRDDFATVWFPLLYVGTNIAYLLLAVPFGKLADRIGRAKVYLGGHVALLAVYLTAAAPLGGAAWTLLSLALLGVFYAATDGVLPALVTKLVPAEARGTGIASAQTAVVVARFASSLGFAGLWLALGPAHALLLVAALLTVAIPVAVWLLRPADNPVS
jgi:MFS family permease